MNSPSPSPVVCATCHSSNSRFDRFCGICGAQLARLRWYQALGDSWQEGDGRLAITDGGTAQITFSNDGDVPVALILDEQELDGLPYWLDTSALRGRPVRLLPGAGPLSIDIPLVGGAALSRTDLETHEAQLAFLHSAGTRPLHLTVVLARQPWVQPAASLYRFLPIERLREGIVHEVEIHNAAAGIVELTEITIEDDESVAPPIGYERVRGERLLHWDIRLPLKLDPGVRWPHRVHLKADEPPLLAKSLGWFSSIVRYKLIINGADQDITSRLSGALGRGPTLEFRGPETVSSITPDRNTQHSFIVRNPGQLSVEVQSVEVQRELAGRKEPAPNPDWLVLKGLTPGDLIGPGEERTLVVSYRPEARIPDEFRQVVSARTIQIRHDGWQESSTRNLLCKVVSQLGRAEERVLGIDFGTSNSVACLMGEEEDEGYPLILEFGDEGPERKYLPSLMYFDGREVGSSDPELFLYGESAKSSANIEPANLVRSIKTIVIDGAKSAYDFIKKGVDGAVQYVKVTTLDLLNLFIRHLRTQAEQGALRLDPEILENEGLDDCRVLFRSAVFSHPVEMTEDMKVALMTAAHRAGINTEIQTPEEFFEERCVDEATAAVLAYVNQLMAELSKGGEGQELKDSEKILCIDMGGGSTDIATVAVRDLAAYVADSRGKAKVKVTIELWSKSGDRRFAGDVLDRLLAKEILNLIEQQSRANGSPVLIDEVMRAVAAPSYSSYRLHFQERMRSDLRLRRFSEGSDPHTIYGLAWRVLEVAEAAKQAFSTESQLKKVFTGTGWPREQERAPNAIENIEIVLNREIFEKLVDEEWGKRFHLLDAVVEGARWDWSSVTTLLLTGQSMRSPIIRRPIHNYVRNRMGEEATKNLVIVQPGDGSGSSDRLDPKTCVAIGAAIWGISRTRGHSWLVIHNPYLEQLTFDLTTKGGRKYIPIEGLENGATFPARGLLEFSSPRKDLILYRNQKKFVQFTDLKPADHITVIVESLTDYYVIVDGEKYRGEIVQ